MSRSASRALVALTLPATLLVAAPTTAKDDTAPVIALVAPVVDLDFATADLKGAARVEEGAKKVKVTLASEVLFAKDSARLRPVAAGRLEEVADKVSARGKGTVTITGYTDDLGSAAHGLALSRQRAQAVARALRPLLDRADHPFVVAGKGEADPAAPNDSEAHRRLNRRVVLSYQAGR
jgi:OOP family OmpA-OmpF porin